MWARLLVLTLAILPTFKPPAEPERGVVAQLTVTGDLDCRVMADDIVNWLARRDPTGQTLAVMIFDTPRARPDLIVRIARAVQHCPVPVAVHLDRRGPVEPGVVLIGLAAGQAFISRGCSIEGDQATRLPDLCADPATGWRGDAEQLAREVIAEKDPLVLDLLIPPLRDVFYNGESQSLSRTLQSKSDERIVQRMDDQNWHIEVSHDAVVALGLAAEANSLGEILRACNVRAFHRERAEVSSGLHQALARAGALRTDLSTRVVRLNKDLKDVQAADRLEFDRLAGQLRSDFADARVMLDDIRAIAERFPELYHMTPPWAFDASGDEAAKAWSKEFERLASELDELRARIDALEKP